jgi:hypothetical protein
MAAAPCSLRRPSQLSPNCAEHGGKIDANNVPSRRNLSLDDGIPAANPCGLSTLGGPFRPFESSLFQRQKIDGAVERLDRFQTAARPLPLSVQAGESSPGMLGRIRTSRLRGRRPRLWKRY